MRNIEPIHGAWRATVVGAVLAALTAAGCNRREDATITATHDEGAQLLGTSAAHALSIGMDAVAQLSLAPPPMTAPPEPERGDGATAPLAVGDEGEEDHWPDSSKIDTGSSPGTKGKASRADGAPAGDVPLSASEAAERKGKIERPGAPPASPVSPGIETPRPVAPTAPAETEEPRLR